jgi:hypothetical protein
MDDINWHVVENGLDYFASAVEYLAKADERGLKYATLHAFAGIETLLKARLAREHWSLVIVDPDKARRATFESGDFRSTTATQTLTRLKNIAGAAVTDDDLKTVAAIESLRNRAAHFSLRGQDQLLVEVVVARGVDFLLRFIEHELRPTAPDDEAALIDGTLDTVREQIGNIKILVTERLGALKPQLDRADAVLICPGCEMTSLVLNIDESAHCLYCLYAPDGEIAAEQYVAAVQGITQYEVATGGGEWPVHHCPRCETKALVDNSGSFSSPEPAWACFSCGFTGDQFDVERCERCNEITGTSPLCAECMADYDVF